MQLQEIKKREGQLKKLKLRQSINVRVRKTFNNVVRNDNNQSKKVVINTLTQSNLE